MSGTLNQADEFTGVILAGGRSKRMGCDKALLMLNGKPLIQRVAETLTTVFAEVIISTNTNDYDFLCLRVVNDLYHDCEPLARIYAALTATKKSAVFVAPCDVPLISAAFIGSFICHPFAGDALVASARGCATRFRLVVAFVPCAAQRMSRETCFFRTGVAPPREFFHRECW